ncbi:MFS transporter [Massilia sp. CMS3.1]|uniref:MFS transporter n=1 Tax=Massilia sp. CMS3.1 TaxID=3373083 RepID=UPI003EE61B6D
MSHSLNRSATLAGVAAGAFLGPFTQTVYTPALVQLEQFFHVNTLLINLTISLFTAILALSNFVIGPIADRWGRRATLLPGLAIFIVGSLLCLAAESYGLFLAGRVLQGAGISAAVLIAPTVIGDIFAPDERARAMSTYQTISFLGPVLGPVLGGAIAYFLAWQWIFALLATAGTVVLLYNWRRLQETLPPGTVPPPMSLRVFGEVLRDRSACSVMLVGFSQFYGYYVFLVFLPVLLHTMLPRQDKVFGLFFVPLTLGLLLGVRLGARWQKHWRRTRILNAASYGMAGTVALFWMALHWQQMNMVLLVLLLSCYGLLLGCSTPVQSTIMVNLFQHQKGTAIGLYNFARFSGAAIGPLIGGALVMRYSVNAVFLLLAVLLTAAACVIGRHLSDPYEAR